MPAGGSAPRSLPGGGHGRGRASSGQPFNCWAGALPAEGDYGFADCSLAQARELTQLGSALAPEGAASAPGGQAALPRAAFVPSLGFSPPPGEYTGCLPKQRSGARTPGSLPSSTSQVFVPQFPQAVKQSGPHRPPILGTDDAQAPRLLPSHRQHAPSHPWAWGAAAPHAGGTLLPSSASQHWYPGRAGSPSRLPGAVSLEELCSLSGFRGITGSPLALALSPPSLPSPLL